MMQIARMMRIAVAMLLLAGIRPIWAQDARPEARLQFSSISVGLLLGYSQGQGTLDFAGRQYPFTVSGIKLATVGISQISAVGQVYRLREAADLAGRYVAVEGALTLIQGGGSAVLRNARGVTLYLQNLQQGLELTLGGGSLSIVLTEPTEGIVPAALENTSAR